LAQIMRFVQKTFKSLFHAVASNSLQSLVCCHTLTSPSFVQSFSDIERWCERSATNQISCESMVDTACIGSAYLHITLFLSTAKKLKIVVSARLPVLRLTLTCFLLRAISVLKECSTYFSLIKKSPRRLLGTSRIQRVSLYNR
jgi:hypothetical protein